MFKKDHRHLKHKEVVKYLGEPSISELDDTNIIVDKNQD